MDDLLIRRFEIYFRHIDPAHNTLMRGDSAVACRNLRAALDVLDMEIERDAENDRYDIELEEAVQKFQRDYNHRVADGTVGPRTRELLVTTLLQRYDVTIFDRLWRTGHPSVFISYARADGDRVNKLDQWLRDHGIFVIRDERDFVAGTSIDENVRGSIARADKVIAVYSENSKIRDWPQLERSVAEELEKRLVRSVLIYLRLDAVELPDHDKNRLAIDGVGETLRDVGQRILQSLEIAGLDPEHFPYDEDEPI